jgi:hypothetical protein
MAGLRREASDDKAARPTRQEILDMADIVFIVVLLAFFALCVAYTRGLDRLVRASEKGEATHEVTTS